MTTTPDPDSTFDAAEAIASVLDSAGLTAARQFRVGRWAALVVVFDGKPYVLTLTPA